MRSKTILALLIVISAASLTMAFPKFQTPRTFSVVLPEKEWISGMQTVANAIQIMKQSTLPANIVNQWTDSLNAFQTKLGQQLQRQILEQQKDSLNHKK